MFEDVFTLKKFLDSRVAAYNSPSFINDDPISVPHIFSKPEDIEISAFLTAIIAWGQRKTIIVNANRLMRLMNNEPYAFITHFEEKMFTPFESFCHRTFNATDLLYFFLSLKNIYHRHGGLKYLFYKLYEERKDIKKVLIGFREVFFEEEFPPRVAKHVADVTKGASAKRLNMFLRWMVRDDGKGVDFGIWNRLPASALYIPLDVHSAGNARKLGLLNRKQNDWKAVEELTGVLRDFDPLDPVKYDFALFGMGIYESKQDVQHVF